MDTLANQSHESKVPVALWSVWFLCFGGLVAAFPLYAYLVFGLGYDRDTTADIFAIHVTMAYWVGILAPLLPLQGLGAWSRFQRLQSICVVFMIVSYATHLSWELLWLVFHDSIANARNEMWAYAWWAYIDGGDTRYYKPEANFFMIEILSVINGLVGFTGLMMLWRSKFASTLGALLCMSTAVTHTVLTWYYYGTEFLTGFESVNTASFIDLWVKFVLLNGPWLLFPWLVLIWGYQLLMNQR
ncbi:MAG: hypothetical protein ACSHWQ_02245 [Spongiibacteraceae bacterium]